MTTNVNYSNGNFTTADGNQLFEQSWEVDNPKAAVAIVHGLGEHSARYAHVAAHFNEHGYSVYAYDMLGHGQSEGRKAYVDSIDIWRDDCAQFIERTRQKADGLPLFVLAHSMGGLVFAYLAVTQLPKLSGVILSAPALVPGKDISPGLIRVAKLLSRVTPKLGAQKLDSKYVSRDSAEVQKYDSDPLVFHSAIPARTGAEMLRAMEIVRAGTPKINYPLLAVHGTEDKLVDVEATMQVYARAGAEDKTMRLFDEGYHESHNEPNKAEVLQLYTDWMDERIGVDSAETKSHHKKRAARKGVKTQSKKKEEG